ncbi:MAG: V-type ATP synthase subunit D [Candidatus Nanohaloarchaea archaeon]
MAQDVKPTRSEELRLKESIDLASNGHSILEQKRDGLIHEFMEVVGDAQDVNEELAELYSEARLKLLLTEVYDGEDALRANALTTKNGSEVKLESQNIMGVKVPEIESIEVSRGLMEREYGLTDSSSRIDATADKYEDLLEKVVDAAETQTKIMRLLNEIEKTKRRVNALEHKIIPEMEAGLNKVSQLLEEREREETFRMKKIKSMASQD